MNKKRRPDGRRFFAILRFLNPIEQFRQREADIARDDISNCKQTSVIVYIQAEVLDNAESIEFLVKGES